MKESINQGQGQFIVAQVVDCLAQRSWLCPTMPQTTRSGP